MTLAVGVDRSIQLAVGDGIEVERTDYGFFIRINEKAYYRICDNPLSGTRYDGYGNKINFHKE